MTPSEQKRQRRKTVWRVCYAIFNFTLFGVAVFAVFATHKAPPLVKISDCVVNIKKSPAPVVLADGGMMLPKGTIVECQTTAAE